MGTYAFKIFHISMGSTLCTESEVKSDWTVGNVPSLEKRRHERKCSARKNKRRDQKCGSDSSAAFVVRRVANRKMFWVAA